MNFRQSTNDDIPAMVDLWLKCFDDSREYIEFYFSKRFEPQNAVVLLKSERIIGMIHLLPCKIAPNEKALYWYAACIHPDFRGKGNFKSFATEILKQNKVNGFSNVCRPADGLFSIYQKIGFKNAYFCNVLTKTKTNVGEKLKFFMSSSSDYLEIIQKLGDVSWDKDAIQYALQENITSGGINLGFYFKGKKYVATGIKGDDCYILTNTNITNTVFDHCTDSMCEFLKCNKLVLREYAAGNSMYMLTDSSSVSKESSAYFSLE